MNELLNINNQLNVTYLIEIILARHHPSILEVLKDEKVVFTLKTPALKSIFAIAVMQLRMEDSFILLTEKYFPIAEVKMEMLHDTLMTFTMGQNYGVRSYAQSSIIILYNHIKEQFGTHKSRMMSRIAKSCEIINESMKFKNAARYFEAIKQDFRFTMKFHDEIWTTETFYHLIPHGTKMFLDEISVTAHHEKIEFKIAEMENEPEMHVVADEIMLPPSILPASTSINLQQKYLPYKYQTPSDKNLRTLPSIFPIDSDKNLCLVSSFFLIKNFTNKTFQFWF
jgi:hypothetical protein